MLQNSLEQDESPIEIENKGAIDVREIRKRRKRVIQIGKQQQQKRLLRPKPVEQIEVEKEVVKENSYNDEEERIKVNPKINLKRGKGAKQIGKQQQQGSQLLGPKEIEQIELEKEVVNDHSYSDPRIKVNPKINLSPVRIKINRLNNFRPPKPQKKKRIYKKKNNDKATIAEGTTSIKRKSEPAELLQKVLYRPIAPKLSNCSKIPVENDVENTSSDNMFLPERCEGEQQQQIQPPLQQMQPQIQQQQQIVPQPHIQQQTAQPPQQTIIIQQMQPHLQQKIVPVQHIQQQNRVPQQHMTPQIQQQHIFPLQHIQQQTVQPPQQTIALQQMQPQGAQAIACNEVMAVRYGCDQCSSSWSTPGSLNIHKRIKHSR